MRIRTVTDSTHTFGADDKDAYVRFDSSSAQTAVLNDIRSRAFNDGDTITVVQAGEGALTIVGASGVTINKAETLVIAKQFAGGTIVKVGASAFDFHGYTTAAE
jgi:hypothetical protein